MDGETEDKIDCPFPYLTDCSFTYVCDAVSQIAVDEKDSNCQVCKKRDNHDVPLFLILAGVMLLFSISVLGAILIWLS